MLEFWILVFKNKSTVSCWWNFPQYLILSFDLMMTWSLCRSGNSPIPPYHYHSIIVEWPNWLNSAQAAILPILTSVQNTCHWTLTADSLTSPPPFLSGHSGISCWIVGWEAIMLLNWCFSRNETLESVPGMRSMLQFKV